VAIEQAELREAAPKEYFLEQEEYPEAYLPNSILQMSGLAEGKAVSFPSKLPPAAL